jgi:RNA polymerase sigma-70 factor (ECF subfamily)
MPPMSDRNCYRRRNGFATTRWSVVRRAAGSGHQSAEALASLCETYWYPIYTFIRRQGHDAEKARDLTQEFFVKVLERHAFGAADPSRGRFRAFLLASIRHFLANERRSGRAVKRGGGRPAVSVDPKAAESRYQVEGHHELTPAKLFDRQWALLLLDRALARVRDKYLASGRSEVFDRLKEFLTDDGTGLPYAEIARASGVTVDSVKVSVHRLRRQFRDALIAEISLTVTDASDVEPEIRHLIGAVSS